MLYIFTVRCGLSGVQNKIIKGHADIYFITVLTEIELSPWFCLSMPALCFSSRIQIPLSRSSFRLSEQYSTCDQNDSHDFVDRSV